LLNNKPFSNIESTFLSLNFNSHFRDYTPCLVLNNDRRISHKLVTQAPRPATQSITLFPSQAPRPHDILIDFDNQQLATATITGPDSSSTSSASPSPVAYERKPVMKPAKASLKEHFCFYCSQYCSRLELCKCPSCIISPADPNKWRASSVLRPRVVKPPLNSNTPKETFRIRVQPKQKLNEFEFRPICEPGESVPLYEEIQADGLHQKVTFFEFIRFCSWLLHP